MSDATTEYVNYHDTEWKDSLSMAKPAASFLLRALQDLRLADDTINVEDLQVFAGTIIGRMDLMIGSEKMLKELFDINNQIDNYKMSAHYEVADHLSRKILQAQQSLVRKDDDLPF